MNTIAAAMERYVNSLHPIADPFGVGMSVHLAIFMINWIILYILFWGFTRNASTKFWKSVHDYAGWITVVLAYLLTVAFIWIKNN